MLLRRVQNGATQQLRGIEPDRELHFWCTPFAQHPTCTHTSRPYHQHPHHSHTAHKRTHKHPPHQQFRERRVKGGLWRSQSTGRLKIEETRERGQAGERERRAATATTAGNKYLNNDRTRTTTFGCRGAQGSCGGQAQSRGARTISERCLLLKMCPGNCMCLETCGCPICLELSGAGHHWTWTHMILSDCVRLCPEKLISHTDPPNSQAQRTQQDTCHMSMYM